MNHSLTNHVYTTWGEKYSSLLLRPEWDIFLKIAEKERQQGWLDDKTVGHIIYWFDNNILQEIKPGPKTTLDVRVRIVCCMINRIPSSKLSWELKRQFMECIWYTYKIFYKSWDDWYCLKILGLPF